MSCTIDVNVILPSPSPGGDDETAGDGDELGDGDGDGDGPGDGDGDEPALDFGGGGTPADEACQLAGLDAPLPCDRGPVTTSIEPTIAWTWTGPEGEDSVLVTPLVANLDDDNDDGVLDLCDRPEIVVIAVDLPSSKSGPIPPGHLYVLDSETGELERMIDYPLDATATPAIADLDGDGVAEILAFERSSEIELGQSGQRRVVAFTATGELWWTSDAMVWAEGAGGLAIADLDADGSPEILAPENVLTADGELLWAPPEPPLANSLPVAVDLDLDGTLEVLYGGSVYGHDGELLFELQLPGGKNSGTAAIANFDDDEYPEIYVQSANHRILEHDGSAKAQCGGGSGHPVAIQDIDGDGKAEILHGHKNWFRALTLDDDDHCSTMWSIKLDDGDAMSSGTAFDFLAVGTAVPIYADLDEVSFFDPDGEFIAAIPRVARSSAANPVVADADNDGAAEVIFVHSEPIGGDPEVGDRPTVTLVHNADDRFAPTRRIWNQHAYHGTNVREDASVPVEQPHHWLGPNSFRTNVAPSYEGPLCQPPGSN